MQQKALMAFWQRHTRQEDYLKKEHRLVQGQIEMCFPASKHNPCWLQLKVTVYFSLHHCAVMANGQYRPSLLFGDDGHARMCRKDRPSSCSQRKRLPREIRVYQGCTGPETGAENVPRCHQRESPRTCRHDSLRTEIPDWQPLLAQLESMRAICFTQALAGLLMLRIAASADASGGASSSTGGSLFLVAELGSPVLNVCDRHFASPECSSNLTFSVTGDNKVQLSSDTADDPSCPPAAVSLSTIGTVLLACLLTLQELAECHTPEVCTTFSCRQLCGRHRWWSQVYIDVDRLWSKPAAESDRPGRSSLQQQLPGICLLVQLPYVKQTSFLKSGIAGR